MSTGTDPFTLDELTELALAADPDQPVEPRPDAVPFGWGGDFPELLPSWYMPMPTSRRRSRVRTAVVLVVLGAFGLINALGFCITYGRLTIG